jgi:hypothetical protein
LEQVLLEAIDPDQRIFDVPTANMADCRVVVVTNRTSDWKARILANHRGLGYWQGDKADCHLCSVQLSILKAFFHM